MFLPQASFFAAILEKASLLAMGLGKLELKRESAVGQNETKLPSPVSSAPGGITDMIDLIYGCPFRLFIARSGHRATIFGADIWHQFNVYGKSLAAEL